MKIHPELNIKAPTKGCVSIPDRTTFVVSLPPVDRGITDQPEVCCRCHRFRFAAHRRRSGHRYRRWNYICMECQHKGDFVMRNPAHMNESPEETLVREALEVACIEKCKQEYLMPGRKWRVDFFFPRIKLAIEIDSTKHQGFRKRTDAGKDAYAKTLGWTLERVYSNQPDLKNHVLALIHDHMVLTGTLPSSLPEISRAEMQRYQFMVSREERKRLRKEQAAAEEPASAEAFVRRWCMHYRRVFRVDYKFDAVTYDLVEQFFKQHSRASLKKLFEGVIFPAWKHVPRANTVAKPGMEVCHGSATPLWCLSHVEKLCKLFRISPDAVLGSEPPSVRPPVPSRLIDAKLWRKK